MLINEQGYLDWNHLFSYNVGHIFRHIFVVGDRGVGKTYGLTDWLLPRCIENKEKFIWIRNTDIAVEEITKFNAIGFLADHPARKGYDESMFTLTKNNLIYGEQLIGTFTSLGSFPKVKGINRDDYKWFIFDEFMPEKRESIRVDYDYALKSILQSTFRKRKNFTAFYLANVLKTSSNVLDFFKFDIEPHFQGQVIQRNKRKAAMMFYLQNKNAEQLRLQHEGDEFAMANVYTESPTIIDYKNNLDPKAGADLKVKEIIAFIASELSYYLLRERKDGKIAVLKVKKLPAGNRAPVYALNKKHVFGDIIYDNAFKKQIELLWNNGQFVFKTEYAITQFSEALFSQ